MRISHRRRHPGAGGSWIRREGFGSRSPVPRASAKQARCGGPAGLQKKGLDLAPALTTSLTANCRLTLPLPLGARLFVEAALPEFGVETRPLHLTLETAKGPLEAFVVLNGYFQKITTPLQVGRSQRYTDNRMSDQGEDNSGYGRIREVFVHGGGCGYRACTPPCGRRSPRPMFRMVAWEYVPRCIR